MSDLPVSLRHVNEGPSSSCFSRYNSDAALSQYCDAHYGPDKFGVENFSVRLVRLSLEVMPEAKRERALDLGCAVGRASFELARTFRRVEGVDYSSRFIALADRLRERGRLNYPCREEGELVSSRVVSLAEFGLEEAAGRVRFSQGDAQQLAQEMDGFSFILLANLVDRLPNPGRFLQQIHQRLNLGGVLALATPYAWLDVYTPRQNWLSGRFERGRPLYGDAGIKKYLVRRFSQVGPAQEVEFVIRETARYFQHGISQLTLWRREC